LKHEDAIVATPLKSMKFWINAFIPRNVPGFTKPVPKGRFAGKTMIPGPTVMSDCFLTDQRTFSNQIHAKSRMHSEFKVTIGGSKLSFTQRHNCDHTTECDCEDGDQECHKKGAVNRMAFKFPVGPDPSRPMHIDLNGASNNPCHGGSPDIDYQGVITIDLAIRSIAFNGKLDGFPAFEAYATINDGAGVTMFQKAPKAGNTPWNLVGPANVSVSAKLVDKQQTGRLQ
jgi:hypothetical protein